MSVESLEPFEAAAEETPAPRSEKHIVDVLIEERARHLLQNPVVWRLVKRLGYPLLRYTSARAMADDIAHLDGRAVFDHVSDLLSVRLRLEGTQYIPRKGRFILIANHPTGIADGIAVYDALKPIRPDMCFFANRDAIRVNAALEDMIIPVEWVEQTRSKAKSRETVKRMVRAFRDESAIIMFPSGKLARPSLKGLREQAWMSTVVNMARRNNAPLVPLHMSGRNSLLYYIFQATSTELRDMTLFNEILNKKNYTFGMTFGAPIPPEALDGDAQDVTNRLKDFVQDDLKRDPGARFKA